jgi:hypothetical protein
MVAQRQRGKKFGFMVLVYDNLCFVCSDPTIAGYLRDKITQNLRLANVTEKHSSVRFVGNEGMFKEPT